MSDIVNLLRQARANMLGTDDEDLYWTCHDAAAEIERLRARLAEAERDAARYRWLRTREASWYSDGDRVTLDHTPAIDANLGRTLDYLIDAAMRSTDSASGGS